MVKLTPARFWCKQCTHSPAADDLIQLLLANEPKRLFLVFCLSIKEEINCQYIASYTSPSHKQQLHDDPYCSTTKERIYLKRVRIVDIVFIYKLKVHLWSKQQRNLKLAFKKNCSGSFLLSKHLYSTKNFKLKNSQSFLIEIAFMKPNLGSRHTRHFVSQYLDITIKILR